MSSQSVTTTLMNTTFGGFLSPRSQYQQGLMLKLSTFMGAGAFAWAIVVVLYGKPVLAVTPVVFIILTIINSYACKYESLHTFGCNFQIFISILLPFVFQVVMGGLANSGMVMIWSLVAMGGVLTFVRGKMLFIWLFYMLALMIISIATDDIVAAHFNNPLGLNPKWYFAINGTFSGVALFFVGLFFVESNEKAKQLLAEANSSLNSVNSDLFEKNSELTNGLRYAATIQQAINPTTSVVERIFPESFLMQVPKDHVSGDFLWLTEVKEWKIAACADCTGHGISGGLLAMMGSCIINGLVHEQNITEPAELLFHMNSIVTERLNQEYNGNHDGMELSIIALNQVTNELKFATAGGSVLLLKHQTRDLQRFRLHSRHIGGDVANEEKNFYSKSLMLQAGDRVYLATDGLADQFGGPKDKKFSRKRLRKTLEGLNNTPISEQSSALKKMFLDWKGKTKQTDDILIFGFEI